MPRSFQTRGVRRNSVTLESCDESIVWPDEWRLETTSLQLAMIPRFLPQQNRLELDGCVASPAEPRIAAAICDSWLLDDANLQEISIRIWTRYPFRLAKTFCKVDARVRRETQSV